MVLYEGSAFPWHFDFFASAEICTRYGALHRHNFLYTACRNDFTAAAPCTGADIHNKIRRAHGILVMLHHNQGVADITQVL